MQILQTEILVIGSGFGAAAPAMRLSEAGCRVLMLEKGGNIVPEKDFRQTNDPKYLLRYLKGTSAETIGFTYAEGLGGGSGFYEMVSLRAPSMVFDLTDRDGRRLWPGGIDRRAMDHYYDLAEKMLHVEQIGVDEIPKSGVAFARLMKNLGYSCDRARYAVKGCVGSGYCVSGCIYGAKQSLHLNYIPQARKAGTGILTDVEALRIRPLCPARDSGPNRTRIANIPERYEVECRNSATGETLSVRAKVVILGGGTVGTAKLLLASGELMPRLSDHVGKNIAFNGSVKAVGVLPEGFLDADMLSGRSHPGMISYHFLETLGITISCAKPLPLHAVSAARLVLDGEQRDPDYWGDAHVELMKLFRRRMVVLYALGLTPPSASIRLRRDGQVEPGLEIDDGLAAYYRNTKAILHSILTRNGARVVKATGVNEEGAAYDGIRFETTHMIGSCRMADTKERGVTDAYGEVFDYPGLFVTDGAAIPTSLAVNSSLTILANAERIAANLVRRFRMRPFN
ncbi:MAG TPA: GMC family oxidoreductase [Bacteroidota bacterium]|nr:GMC family oxidoreductase [Bacteroidota bacterium]